MSAAGQYAPPSGSIPTLPVPSLAGVRRAHLIGIGGAGMRNLARLLLARGVVVSGSDLKDSHPLRDLRDLGAAIWIGHEPSQVGLPDVVVISSAIAERNVELVEARRLHIDVWARQQALAALAVGRRAVAVSGTHGKTTTTSMIAVILERAGLDPTYLIGGDLNESGSGARAGGGDLFVFEADESDGSFLLTRPEIGIITNVDVDHLDFYPGGRDEIQGAFAEFAKRCGLVVACVDDEGARSVIAAAGVDALTYGTDPTSRIAVSVEALGPEGAHGRVRLEGSEEVAIHLPIDGEHNLLNAAAAIAVARTCGVDPASAAGSLRTFTGVHRRFEFRGEARGAAFFDDYGHIPAEMAVTLQTARRRRPRRLIAVVQPHRYSRVQALWRELGASVTEADLVLVTDIYGAAQEPIPGVTGELVVEGVRVADPSTPVLYLPHLHDVVGFLDREVREGDLVVTMGCGDVWMMGDAALAKIGESER